MHSGSQSWHRDKKGSPSPEERSELREVDRSWVSGMLTRGSYSFGVSCLLLLSLCSLFEAVKPALAQADIGNTIGVRSDVAVAPDVILCGPNPLDVVAARGRSARSRPGCGADVREHGDCRHQPATAQTGEVTKLGNRAYHACQRLSAFKLIACAKLRTGLSRPQAP